MDDEVNSGESMPHTNYICCQCISVHILVLILTSLVETP